MQINKIIFTLLILIIPKLIQGQQLLQISSCIKGRIIDDSTGNCIAFVHIYNESQRRGYIANAEGRFRIPASEGDTLVLSALGYLGKVIFISDSCIHSDFTIKLTTQVYQIDEVTVRAFRDYEDFKKQFLALKLPETETIRLRENLRLIARQEATNAANNKKASDAYTTKTNTELVTVGIPILSREDKQRLNYVEVLKKEARQRAIDKKYNREIIYKVTQLSEDEITEFMGFCNFSEEFLYHATEYEILVKIEEKFKEYKLMKECGGLFIEYEKIPDALLGKKEKTETTFIIVFFPPI